MCVVPYVLVARMYMYDQELMSFIICSCYDPIHTSLCVMTLFRVRYTTAGDGPTEGQS